VAALPVAQHAADMNRGRDANLLETLATAQRMNGNLAAAIDAQRQAVARARLGGPYNRADLEARLTRYLIEQGDLLGASAVSWQGVATRLGRSLFSTEPAGASLIQEAEELSDEGRFVEAAGVLRGCLAIRQKELPAGHWLIADTQSQLGAAVASSGKLSEAEPILLQAYQVLQRNGEAPPECQRLAVERIIRLYQRWDKIEQISKWQQILEQQLPVPATGDRRTAAPDIPLQPKPLSVSMRGIPNNPDGPAPQLDHNSAA
jgi:tetratricopeptide (TPR) repeat protein